MIMFVIHAIQRNICRHGKKSFLSILISFMIVLFLLLYIENIKGNEAQLVKLGETIPVTARVCNIDGTQEVGLQIDFDKLQKVRETGLVTDEVITIQIYGDLAVNSQEEKPHFLEYSFVGSNTLSAFSAFSPQDVSYTKNYDESFLTRQEAVCIVRDELMKEQKLNTGDDLEIIVYAPEYDEYGGYTFLFQSLGIVKLKVIGSYSTGKMVLSEDLPDIISSIGFVANLYEGTDAKRYASSARFMLEDPLKLNEFKSTMQEAGFASVNMQESFSRVGAALTMNDETFIMSATQLTESLTLLKSFAPLIFIIVTIIGFISSYLLMQSRKNEFAIMRSLGTSRKKSFKIIFLESAILVFSGSLLAAIIAAFLVNIKVLTMGFVLTTFLFFYMLGTVIALLLLNRFSVMAILSKTD